jgi:hypothetical protein
MRVRGSRVNLERGGDPLEGHRARRKPARETSDPLAKWRLDRGQSVPLSDAPWGPLGRSRPWALHVF